VAHFSVVSIVADVVVGQQAEGASNRVHIANS
jgi:hypothetical protein